MTGPRVDRESPIQRGIVTYLRTVIPDGIVHHCRNEIRKRGSDIAIELSWAKRQGAYKGFPDLLVMVPGGRTVFFEVKAPKGYATPEQRALHEKMRDLGHSVAIVRGIDDVRAALREWQIPVREVVKV